MKFLYCKSHEQLYSSTTKHGNGKCIKRKFIFCNKCELLGFSEQMQMHTNCDDVSWINLTKMEKAHLLKKLTNSLHQLIETRGKFLYFKLYVLINIIKLYFIFLCRSIASYKMFECE
jgi:hypothetical protein